ncbi:MAG: hypothetical protein CMJ18_17370 [Phycisphaeraceae bacterium]|nr:hypothetical protein [Phycisphaeraceae bacterium]
MSSKTSKSSKSSKSTRAPAKKIRVAAKAGAAKKSDPASKTTVRKKKAPASRTKKKPVIDLSRNGQKPGSAPPEDSGPKGVVPPLRPSQARSGEEETVEQKPPTLTQLRKVKTGLTRKELEQYRQLLLDKRKEILGDVEALETDARTDSGDHHSPDHMADIGSSNYEQEFTLGLVESERQMLREIDEALHRIANRTYGVCLERAIPIGRPRLDAKPWAKYCIEVVREKERLGEL